MTQLQSMIVGCAVAALCFGLGLWYGRRTGLRRLRRYSLTREGGSVEDMAFQPADDGAMEILLRRKTMKEMLAQPGRTLEGKLEGQKGSMMFRVRLHS